MDRDYFSKFDVSEEAFACLEVYHALLLKWQAAVNLVSPKTLDEAWQRHFLDSVQLLSSIDADVKTIADIGSGAGFPGLVLALCRPDLEVHLIESDMKKCQFLSTVLREASCSSKTSLRAAGEAIQNGGQSAVDCRVAGAPRNDEGAQVHNARIEEAYDLVAPDLITARALASLEKLFDYAMPWVEANPECKLLLLKGAKAQEEIEAARTRFDFTVETFDSVTDAQAKVLKISDLRLK